MRLLALIVGVIFVVVLSFITIRFWGNSQSYAKFDHPLLNLPSPVSIVQIDNPGDAEILSKEDPNAVFALPTRLTADGSVIVMGNESWAEIQSEPEFKKLAATKTTPLTKVQYITYDELLAISPAIHKLDGFLQSYPQQNFILVIEDNVENIHQKVSDIVQNILPHGSIAIASQIDAVIKSSKEIRPLTSFSLSSGEQVRLVSFGSIGLISALQINGDFVYSPLTWNKRSLLSHELVQEMHRRFKKVFVGPVSTPEEIQQGESLEVDGFIFPGISEYKKLKTVLKK